VALPLEADWPLAALDIVSWPPTGPTAAITPPAIMTATGALVAGSRQCDVSAASGHRLVLLGRDAWLASNDEVPLAYCPLVPPVEGHFKGVAECTRYRFRRRTREDCTMDRDWLPSTKPRGECGHEFR